MTSDLTVTLTLGVGTLIICTTHLLTMLYLSVNFYQICFSSYEKHNFRHNLTFDMIVTLILGVGNLILVRNTLTHYVLSFCEVPLNLIQ